MMALYGISYLVAGIVMLGLDAIWLKVMGSAFYRPLLGGMLLDKFSLPPAIAFYLLYVAGIVVFAVVPAIGSGRWSTALVNGALLGLVAYGTYDLTNQATLKNWPWTITVIDLCWGTTLTAICAVTAWLAASLSQKMPAG